MLNGARNAFDMLPAGLLSGCDVHGIEASMKSCDDAVVELKPDYSFR